MAQTAEAVLLDGPTDEISIVMTAACSGGDVIQLPDGRAGVVIGQNAADSAFSAGDTVGVATAGRWRILKTASIVLVEGGECMWDHSANTATYPLPASDKDFVLGRVIDDAAAADTTVDVQLNELGRPIISLQDSAFDHAPVLTSGTPVGSMQGGAYRAAFSATAEAQKLDLLSYRSFPINSDWIFEAIVEVVTNADADVGDLNVGVANGTHASDADSITESVFLHFDMGADANLDAESDDGTTEVAATDTTVDWAVGTPVHIVIDGRDHTDIQIYVNGANVLPSSTFTLAAGTGPLKALFHLEKSSNDSPGEVLLHKMEVRITPDLT